jgi:hypothetical protein
MNSLVITIACADDILMDRMRQMGDLVVAVVRKGIGSLEDKGVLAKSELLIGTPGYAIVLGMTGGKHRTRYAQPGPSESEDEEEPSAGKKGKHHGTSD